MKLRISFGNIGSSSLRKAVLLILGLTFYIRSISVLLGWNEISIVESIPYSIVYVVYVLVFVLSSSEIYALSPIMMVVYYTLIQGVGIPLGFIFDKSVATRFLMRDKLMYGLYLDQYLAITILAVQTILFTLILVTKNERSFISSKREIIIKDSRNYYLQIGTFLIVLFSLFMIFELMTGNISLVDHGAYTSWAVKSRARNYLQFGYWFGSLFVISSFKEKKQLIIPGVFFATASLILMLSGNRNDFLIPLLVCVAIYVLRGNKIPKTIIVALLVFVFLISPIVASTRFSGAGMIDNIKSESRNYFELLSSSLCELGSQLTPVSSMFSWLDGDVGFALGGTYFYSTVYELGGRFFQGYTAWFNNSYFDLNTKLPDLGFSMCGELYYNFGVLGIIIIYTIITVIMARKENRIIDIDSLIRYAFGAFTMLFLVRNAFSSYIFIIILFYIVYFIEKALRGTTNGRTIKV